MQRRSREKTNRRLHTRGRSIWAAMAADEFYETDQVGVWTHCLRFALSILLLPVFWVTAWTFMTEFSRVTVTDGIWQSAQFWYFTIGAILMLGWFWSGLWRKAFLYIYVLGHELTHAAFVKLFGGRVLDMDWGSHGGYVTTDKTNWVIALSPYFVPFWSVVATVIFSGGRVLFEITPIGNLVFYGVIGSTWAFHLTWTLWMIPRDQPDLRDNGTFLSLILICLGNLVVLVGLLCMASPDPGESLRDFLRSWLLTILTWGRGAWG